VEFLKGYQLYSFIDGGRVWNIDATSCRLRPHGVGLRMLCAMT